MNNNLQNTNQSKKHSKILYIILIIIVIIITLLATLFLVLSSNTNKLICQSNKGSITLLYDDKTIKSYTAKNGISYDINEQRKIAEQIGMSEYIKNFNNWFRQNTGGTCITN